MSHSALGAVTVHPHHVDDLCVVAPAPELKEKLIDQFERLRNRAADLVGRNISLRSPNHVGLNDGLIYPGTYYPSGTTAAVVAAGRAGAGAVARRRTGGRGSGGLQRQGDGRRAAARFNAAVLLHRRAAARQRQGVLRRRVRRADRHPGRGGRAVSDAPDHRGLRRRGQRHAGRHTERPDHGQRRGHAWPTPTWTSPRTTTTATDSSTPSSWCTPGGAAEETGAAADIWSHKWVLPSERVGRRHQDLRLPDHSRGRQDRRDRARARPPGLRLARPVRHRQHLGGHRQLVPDGVRLLGTGR